MVDSFSVFTTAAGVIISHTLQEGRRDQKMTLNKGILDSLCTEGHTREKDTKRENQSHEQKGGNKDTARDETPNALLFLDVIASNQSRFPPFHLPV